MITIGNHLNSPNNQLINHSFTTNEEHYRIDTRLSQQIYFENYSSMSSSFLNCSLCEAVQIAFEHTETKHWRPLLVYIHHQQNSTIDEFSSKASSAEVVADYLLTNYVIWSCNIADEDRRRRLIEDWRILNFTDFPCPLSAEHCPIFIGVVRTSSNVPKTCSAARYEFKILLRDNSLVYARQNFDIETFLDAVCAFKEKFDGRKGQHLPKIGKNPNLPLDIILDIAEYLSFNDAVNVFSPQIIPVLNYHKILLPVIDPCSEFMILTNRLINPKQITSLCIKESHMTAILEQNFLFMFSNVMSLTLCNFQNVYRFNDINLLCPKLKQLRLRYDSGVSVHRLCRIFNYISNHINRFEIHCGYIMCSHRRITHFYRKVIHLNNGIEHFLLSMTNAAAAFHRGCKQNHDGCLLGTITDFLKLMKHIRNVCLVFDVLNIDKLLDANNWASLAERCQLLERITLKANKTIIDSLLKEKILQIQQCLSNVRSKIALQTIIK